jgi:hypothetical protein
MNLQRIDLALKLLNDIEVKGATNLNNLLGAIQLLEGFKKEAATFNVDEQEVS